MANMYFDDFNIGDKFVSPNRTITETDIVTFAGLTADYNPLHTDEVFAKSTVFGGRIAHGLLGASIAVGLWCRLGLVDGTALAFLQTEWKFIDAIMIGDTICNNITISDKKLTSKPDKGILFIKFDVTNQHGKVVSEGLMRLMVKANPLKGE